MKWIAAFNFAGVCLLAVISVSQWKVDGRLHERTVDQDRTIADQRLALADRDRQLREARADLDDFRERLWLAENQIGDDRRLLSADRQTISDLTADRDQLKTSLASWIKAVAERDDSLHKAIGQIKEVARQRDETIGKFNDLVRKYNDLGK